jgi:hypothetical protein
MTEAELAIVLDSLKGIQRAFEAVAVEQRRVYELLSKVHAVMAREQLLEVCVPLTGFTGCPH